MACVRTLHHLERRIHLYVYYIKPMQRKNLASLPILLKKNLSVGQMTFAVCSLVKSVLSAIIIQYFCHYLFTAANWVCFVFIIIIDTYL